MGKYDTIDGKTVEAEQLTLNLIPCYDGGWMSSHNPFGAVVMRRPRWWKPAIPMIETKSGWMPISPWQYVVRDEQGYTAMDRKEFEEAFAPVTPGGPTAGERR